MRGHDDQAAHLFSYVSPEQRVPADHPLRPIRQMTDGVLATLSRKFTTMYSDIGRPSIPPEKLLRALLLQVLYSIRSERMLIEQLEYNLLFRWCVSLAMDADLWVATTFTKAFDRIKVVNFTAAEVRSSSPRETDVDARPVAPSRRGSRRRPFGTAACPVWI